MLKTNFNLFDTQTILVSLIVFSVAFLRIIPHIYNFSPVIALAIFGAVHFKSKTYSYFIVMLSIILSDIILLSFVYNVEKTFLFFYEGFYWQYISYFLIILLCFTFKGKKIGLKNIAFLCVSSSLIFFTVSNFGFWLTSGMYSLTLSGLLECYIKAIPFYQGTLLGSVFYTPIFFGSYYFLQKKNSAFRMEHLTYWKCLIEFVKRIM